MLTVPSAPTGTVTRLGTRQARPERREALVDVEVGGERSGTVVRIHRPEADAGGADDRDVEHDGDRRPGCRQRCRPGDGQVHRCSGGDREPGTDAAGVEQPGGGRQRDVDGGHPVGCSDGCRSWHGGGEEGHDRKGGEPGHERGEDGSETHPARLPRIVGPVRSRPRRGNGPVGESAVARPTIATLTAATGPPREVARVWLCVLDRGR